MPYGMTAKNINELVEKLSVKLNKNTSEVRTAINEIVSEDLLRIAANKPEKEVE
jgi:hypothetical protein